MRSSRVSRGLSVAGVLAVGLIVLGVRPTAAEVSSSGTLEIRSAEGGTIAEGGSRTPFSLLIPPGAECQGDSADDGYVVHSFMIPSNEDPASLTFSPQPEGEGRYPLYLATTGRYSNQLTQDAPELGDPGVLDQPEPFSFEAFEGAEIPSGEYRIGIACSFEGKTTRYWDTVMVVTRAADTQPVEYSFTVPGANSDVDREASAGWALALGVVVLLVLAVGVLVVVRRRSSHPKSELSKESS
ncbi:MAG: hypothetical protein MUE36_11700 [Acidimicrobiales bacterium]|jgi:hypothetical protein|nr:hypothetical protein [Acidimicrobiales bacterium]